MKNKISKSNNGFTLIEALVYLALFGILMSGMLISAYNLFESGSRNSAKIIVEEEGNFLLSKISWALGSIYAINFPAVNTTGSQLLVTAVDPLIGSIDITLNSGNITMTRGGVSQILNNSNVSIANLLFDYQEKGGVEWINYSFTMNTKTADGKDLSRNFEATKYLRK